MKITKELKPYLFIAPSLLGLSVFYIIPFIGGLYYAALDNSFSKHFVGLKNFIEIFSNDAFLLAMKNTFKLTGISVLLIIIIGYTLALLLQNVGKKNALFQTGFVVPMVIPSAALVMIWNMFFDNSGYINLMLHKLSLPIISFSTDQTWSIVSLYIWKNAGYAMILFLAGLQSIPKELCEAASIDGANKFQQSIYIKAKLLLPTFVLVVILSIINSFKMYREVYLLGGPYPNESIYTIQHFINNMFTKLDYQKLVSSAYVFALLVYLLLIGLQKYERSVSAYE